MAILRVADTLTYLSYHSFPFFFSLFGTFVSHFFIIFLPSTFTGTQVRTVRTGSYAPAA